MFYWSAWQGILKPTLQKFDLIVQKTILIEIGLNLIYGNCELFYLMMPISLVRRV